jgi:hypothetical protein
MKAGSQRNKNALFEAQLREVERRRQEIERLHTELGAKK